MKKESIYFKNISIENLRCFGPKQKIDFYTPGSKKISRWNVILGQNGVGKTSVLRALAMTIANAENNRQWRNQIPLGSFNRYGTTFQPKIEYTATSNSKEIKFGLEIFFKSEMNFNGYEDQLDILEKNIVLFAYGATRRIGNRGITSEDGFTAKSIFQENVELINVEEWLVQADYMSIKDDSYKIKRSLVLGAIRKIMQHEISDVYIEFDKNRPTVVFKTDYGNVSLHELSLGYKTFLAWMVDFAKGMIDRYPESDNPLNEPAICLIDEIDLHLHPKLQRDVVDFLLDTFGKTQFIVSSHSPLIVQSNRDVNVILLKKVGDHVEIENNPQLIKNWRIDQILVSDLFGLNSSRANDVDGLLEERSKILSKGGLDFGEEKKLKNLEEKIGKMPTWESNSERKAYNAISKIARMIEEKEANDKN